MIFLYNIIQLIGLILFFPLLFVKTIISPKYRRRIPRRLGLGLGAFLRDLPGDARPRIWIHALSVGEVTSAVPLVKAIRANLDPAFVIFSAATMTGENLARQKLWNQVDLFVPFPLDLFFVCRRFLRVLAPDVFVLVETDFWPNFIHSLGQAGVDSLLVNGRISGKSFKNYRRFRPFFLPMFSAFSFLAMQTAADVWKMTTLGVDAGQIAALGNLKYDAVAPDVVGGNNEADIAGRLGIRTDAVVWVAGSTHEGEEEIILKVFVGLHKRYPKLFLILAPRQIERAKAIAVTASRLGLVTRLRSAGERPGNSAPVLVLDSIGELAGTYRICDMAFVGGSLVAAGGHNPLEAAAFGRPVLFGLHMEDFSEIAGDLVTAGGAFVSRNDAELAATMRKLLADAEFRERAGEAAGGVVSRNRGVTARHIDLIRDLLARRVK